MNRYQKALTLDTGSNIMEHILSILLAGVSAFISLLLSIIPYLTIGSIITILLEKLLRIEVGTILYKKIQFYLQSIFAGLTMGLIQSYLILTYNLLSIYFFIISLWLLYNYKSYFKLSQKEIIIYDICQSDAIQFKKFMFLDRFFSITCYLISIFSISYYLKK